VPIALLRKPQQLDSMPYEMQIIKALVFRVFASPEIAQGKPHGSYFSHCCIYQVSSPLVTQYVHYYDEDRLQVKYRMGFTDTYLQELLTMRRIVVTVVPPRRTKCGDHRRHASGEHRITVNATDNHLAFMLTLLHELAHAFAPRTEHSKPHDKFWKLMFSNLLVDCFGFFPPQLAAYLTLLACNPPSSKDICEDHMVRNCLREGFKEQSLSRIDLLRTMMTFERRFGVKLKPFDL
jgi:hypothetical protein